MAGENQQNDWPEHKLHILNSLKKLEDHNQRQEVVLAKQTEQIGQIHSAITKFETNQKWEFRLLSLVWGVLVTGINYLLGKH